MPPYIKKTRKTTATVAAVATKIVKLAKAKPTLTAQVNNLKKVVNKLKPETREFEKSFYGNFVGQANGGVLLTGSGHFNAEIPVSVPHDGQEVSILSTDIRMQLYNQVSTSHSIRFRVEVWRLVGGLTVASQVVPAMYDVNRFLYDGNTSLPSIYDMNSLLNPQRVRSAVKIYSKKFRMPQEGFSAATETKTINIRIPFKKGHKVIFDTSGNIMKGQLALVILADSGNISSLPLPALGNSYFSSVTPLSGLNLNYFIRHNYVDA